jgi:hypothetical protein
MPILIFEEVSVKNKKYSMAFYLMSPVFFLMMCCIIPAETTSMTRTPAEKPPPEKHSAEVSLPQGYRLPMIQQLRFQGKEISIDLFSGGYSQGFCVYAEIYKNSGADGDFIIYKFSFSSKDLLPVKRPWGYRCIFGIDPESGTGMHKLNIAYSVGNLTRTESYSVPVLKTEYRFDPTPLDLGKYSDVDYKPSPEEIAFIEKCTEKKKRVFGQTGTERLGSSLSHPRDQHFITSPFWSKRLVMRYRKKNGRKIYLKNKLNIHRGVDLRGNVGDPVFSVAHGIVVIAEPMYYEGNFIVVDHGNRIFSYYMHLNDLKVKEGDSVRAGDLIGHVGSSGLSTAAHLHVSFMIQNTYVDPLSVLLLPIRE